MAAPKITDIAIGKTLYYIKKPTRWTRGVGAELPEEYKKFWREWKCTPPLPVHYIPKEGKYERKPDGTVHPVQNVPLPLKYPKELDDGIWGGEAVIRGFNQKDKYTRRVVRYWSPVLVKTVLYSEILDKYMRTMVTRRTMDLVHENYGFDHYLLKTRACDLRSLLALKLKRNMLIDLWDKTLYPDDPAKRDEVYTKYEKYLASYTRDEIEWYGLTYQEACSKHYALKKEMENPVPLKVKFRQELLKLLQAEKEENEREDKETESSWLSKVNPFGNKISSAPAT